MPSRKSLLTILSALCLSVAMPAGASTGAARACPGAQSMPTSASMAQARAATLCLINNQRASHGLRALRANPILQRAADAHSRNMARRHFFNHTAPGGVTLVRRLASAGGYVSASRSWSVGENIAWGGGYLATPSSIVGAWMHSPGHRANILSRGFREIGVGIATGVPVAGSAFDGATYTTDFGARS